MSVKKPTPRPHLHAKGDLSISSSATNSYNCNVPLNLNVPPFFKIGSTGGLYRGPLNRSQKMEA